MKRIIIVGLVLAFAGISWGQVDLVTLPARDSVQLTIYNSADLTLARDSRALTLNRGPNKLQFSWANTLIDPTSLEMMAVENADKVDIANLAFPPRVRNEGLWNIESTVAGRVPVQIAYFTSGLSWRAFYIGTLTADEKNMRLAGYVRVTNNSGEDYENAQIRLIVGKVHLLDQIAELARRQQPYGRPGMGRMGGFGGFGGGGMGGDRLALLGDMPVMGGAFAAGKAIDKLAPKDVIKEGLSEYFLYTIEGTETIPNGWSKRLISFHADKIPVVNLYKYEQQRYGDNVVRFLSFKNDDEHDLGKTPIPGGLLKVYRGVGDGHLSYTGQSAFKYIPVNEDVELNLGAVRDVVVEPELMEFRTNNYTYSADGNVSGWDDVKRFEVEVRNTRDIPVKVEIRRNFPSGCWTLERAGDIDEYEKVDVDTVKFTLSLQPHSVRKFEYTLTTYNGDRQRVAAERAAGASAQQSRL